MEDAKSLKKSLIEVLKDKKNISTMRLKEGRYNKIIVTGLLLPKDKVSRNGILYDWESAKATVNKIPGLPMMYNHQVEGKEKPVGHYVDAIALEKRPLEEGEWQKAWDDAARELKKPEGIPGIYYKADINPDSEYADSITRGDVRKVSIQIIPEDQVKESDEEGNSYTRAFIKDYVEASIVPSPGFMETNMVVMCESFHVEKVKKEYVMTPEFKKHLDKKGMGEWNSEDELEAEYGEFIKGKKETFTKQAIDAYNSIIKENPKLTDDEIHTKMLQMKIPEDDIVSVINYVNGRANLYKKESDRDEIAIIDGKKIILNVGGSGNVGVDDEGNRYIKKKGRWIAENIEAVKSNTSVANVSVTGTGERQAQGDEKDQTNESTGSEKMNNDELKEVDELRQYILDLKKKGLSAVQIKKILDDVLEEQLNTGNSGGASKTKLAGRDEEPLEEALSKLVFTDNQAAKEAQEILFEKGIKSIIMGGKKDQLVLDQNDKNKAIDILEKEGMGGLSEQREFYPDEEMGKIIEELDDDEAEELLESLKEETDSSLIAQIEKRVRIIGKKARISPNKIEDYLDDLKTYFEPLAYRNISDEELLKDIKDYVRYSESVKVDNLFKQIKQEKLLDDRREHDTGDLKSAYPDLSKQEAEELYKKIQKESVNAESIDLDNQIKKLGLTFNKTASTIKNLNDKQKKSFLKCMNSGYEWDVCYNLALDENMNKESITKRLIKLMEHN